MDHRPNDASSDLGLQPDLVAPSLLHELRQPLMGADAAARLLERSFGAELAHDDDWRTLRAQLDRVTEILVDYAELLGPLDREPARYAVGPVVARAVALLAHRTRPLARRFALVHAATNLLANALDAVECTGGEPRVRVRVLPGTAGGVEVRVSDAGIGISEAVRARLFEPRFTTKPPGRGTGLGLHLARRLMERQGGEVFLVPEGDPGRLDWAVTEFCIAIPAPPAGAGA